MRHGYEIVYDLDQLFAALHGRRSVAPHPCDRRLRDTAADRVAHVEVKGKRKGTRRERRAKR